MMTEKGRKKNVRMLFLEFSQFIIGTNKGNILSGQFCFRDVDTMRVDIDTYKVHRDAVISTPFFNSYEVVTTTASDFADYEWPARDIFTRQEFTEARYS